MGYELEWNNVYGMDKDPVRKYLLFPLILKTYKNLLDDKRILDAGCGNGNLMNLLKGFKFKSAIGVDISDDFLMTARQNISDSRIEFIKTDLLLELPFNDGSFDIIFSVFVLNELPSIEKHMVELSRVLESNGELLIIMTHPFLPLYYFLQESFTGIKNQKISGFKGYFDKSKLQYNFTLANAQADFYQYTFQDILNCLTKCSLTIDEVIELKTDCNELLEIQQYRESNDIPKYLFIRTRKLKCT